MIESSSTIFAFSADQAVRLTGLSKRQLHYWDETGFFSPRYALEDRSSPYSRIYSFKDIVGLRALGLLRNNHKVPLQYLRKVAKELSRHMQDPWSGLVLYILNKEVHFKEPETGFIRGALSGQYLVNIALQSIARDVETEASRLRERPKAQLGQIVRKRYIQHNASVLSGTRIPTKAIWRFHKAGYSFHQIISEYPSLTKEDVKAAIAYEGGRVRKSA